MEHVDIPFTDQIRNEHNDANSQYEYAAYKYIFIGLVCHHLDFDTEVLFSPVYHLNLASRTFLHESHFRSPQLSIHPTIPSPPVVYPL